MPRDSGYHVPVEVDQIVFYLHSKFPHLTEVSQIGKSHEGRPIYALKVTAPNQEEKKQVLYVGGIHGCEPAAVEVVNRFLTFVLYGYENSFLLQDLLRKRELWFIPLANPDGHHHYYKGHLIWKKNKNPNHTRKSSLKGVDLNRNFGFKWGFDNKGSSSRRIRQNYRGRAPFSEPETRAIRDFVLEKNFVLSFSYHSFGEQYLYPFSYSKIDPEDIGFYETYAGHLAAKNGYAYGNPKTGEIYLANGDMDDWLYGDTRYGKRKTLAMTVEVTKLFLYPKGVDIFPHFKKTLYGNLFMAEIADHPFRVFGDLPAIELKTHSLIDEVNRRFTNERWVEDLFQKQGEIYRFLRP